MNRQKVDEVLDTLNEIVELELSGAVRYTQYSLMIFGHARIPIIGWMKEQADEALTHALQAGEEVTTLGGRPSLGIGKLVGTHHDKIDAILEELIEHESMGVELYRKLLGLVEGENVELEEYARSMIRSENLHVAEIRKMLRTR
ncbi:MAG TPA: ferritin-like domain-containing protein [Myxococcota bacterium]|nr:ferritin-like domain-containing protein [Myxococcota bacterium]